MLNALEKKAMREALRLLRELTVDLHTIPAASADKAGEHMKSAFPNLTQQGQEQTVAAINAGASKAIANVSGKIGQIEDWLKATVNDQPTS